MASSGGGGGGGGGGGVPPGFRFHPTDEELLHYYLKKKLSFHKFDMEVIREIDLNKIEPWELQERCKIGSTPQSEWYFFSHKDRKYPTGSRTNRATNAGFWKATGRDKCIRNMLKKIGTRKTLVFYRGRAPHGQRTDWIMHEYRLEDSDENSSEDGWVICRVFKKKNLFKVIGNNNEGGVASSNLLNNTSIHQPRTTFTHKESPYLLQHSHDHSLNYSHIPTAVAATFPQHDEYNSHNNHIQLAQNFMSLGYNHHPHDFSSGESGLEVASSHQNMNNDQWGIINEDANVASSSINQINNHLPLRGEMDFWNYGK